MTTRTAWMTLAALATLTQLTGCSDKPLTYQADIKPIIEANCVACHVPGGAGYEKSGLRMDSHEALLKGTRFGPVIVPGSSVSSTLYRLVSGQADPSIRMPHGQASLPEADVATIAAWIDQGAKN
ncbi:MAG: c-type cytochrome domain-containing protein [Thiobacillus sp.]|uniref:c-type cytochrome domain-containing protein n=1 Tax=Thiobacillus sp. TaxID=924 RepID=UPI0027359F02|nr:c-type cytochrome domain-containing protein [Thiobacillus sp.]MDP3586243.1 c-type cytochrome domain-containing protein [Thiobacillus sp.]